MFTYLQTVVMTMSMIVMVITCFVREVTGGTIHPVAIMYVAGFFFLATIFGPCSSDKVLPLYKDEIEPPDED